MSDKKNDVPAPRLPLQMDVEFRRSYARKDCGGILKNISLSGAFLQTETEDLMPADKLLITFVVSGRKRKIHGTVVWKNKKGCGIQFHPNSKRDEQIVDDLMYFVEEKRETRRELLEDIFKRVG